MVLKSIWLALTALICMHCELIFSKKVQKMESGGFSTQKIIFLMFIIHIIPIIIILGFVYTYEAKIVREIKKVYTAGPCLT